MEEKITIQCPSCNKSMRIPQGKHIKFSCPECHHQFEIDGTVKEIGKKKSFFSGFWGLFLTSGIIYFSFTHADDIKLAISDTIAGAKKMINVENPDPVSVQQSNAELYKTMREISKSLDKKRQIEEVAKLKQQKLQEFEKLVDVDNEVTNDYAVRLAGLFPGKYNVDQVCEIYDYLVKHWRYVNDSDKKENFRSASRSINNNLAGDCDDFAILMAALIESIGGTARISLAYNQTGGHAFAEVLAANDLEQLQPVVDRISVFYGNEPFEAHYRTDNKGRCWLNLDWMGTPQHPGGEYFRYSEITTFYPTLKEPYYE